MIEKMIDDVEKKINIEIFDLFDHMIAMYKGIGPHYRVEQWAAGLAVEGAVKYRSEFLNEAYIEMTRFLKSLR